MANRFVWYELMTGDTKAAQEFYGKVVGWGATDSGVPNMSYTIFTAGGRPAAGMMEKPAQNMPSAWLGYVAVDNADAVAAAFDEAGGKILKEPFDIPTVGRIAVLSDPQGAVMAVIKGSVEDPPPHVAPHTPGHGEWHELHTTDHESAFKFYSKLFGWTETGRMDMGEMGVYQLWGIDGQQVGGMFNNPQVPQPFWLYYFYVDNIDAAIDRLTAAGGKVQVGPHPVPTGDWIVQAFDPQGAYFALVGPK